MHIYRVGQITRYVKSLFEADDLLQDLWLEGEVSNWRAYPSGHVYFTLKDAEAAINCVIWRGHAARLLFKPGDGDGVVAHGYISVYEARGAYQFYVDDLQKAGAGLWALEFERLKAKLEAEGLFDAERKRPLPRFPHRLGVVTSAAGAAWRDICRVLGRRYPLVEVVLAPSAVQGDDAPPQIVSALSLLAAHGGLDAIIVARGGGSAEDLWAFNDERVARAIAASPVPVISGVGHETDLTIADLVADVRAPTPSAAAEVAVPDAVELREGLAQAVATLEAGVRQSLAQARADLARELAALRRASPQRLVDRERQRLDERLRALCTALEHDLALRRARLQGLEGRLAPLGPRATLARGYALVEERHSRRLVCSVRQAPPGQPLTVRVADGEFPARAEDGPRGPRAT
jgi:exodeoxyribonuclease VII large subunit